MVILTSIILCELILIEKMINSTSYITIYWLYFYDTKISELYISLQIYLQQVIGTIYLSHDGFSS